MSGNRYGWKRVVLPTAPPLGGGLGNQPHPTRRVMLSRGFEVDFGGGGEGLGIDGLCEGLEGP